MQYPTIDLDQLTGFTRIIENALADTEYLDPAVCPYDEKVREQIRKIIAPMQIVSATVLKEEKNPVGRPSKQTIIPLTEVEKEVDEIRKEITQLKIDAKGLETADRIQIIKTRAALVEKIIGMKERINSMKQQQTFIAKVIQIMEDVLEQKQREEVMDELKVFLEA